MLEQLAGRLAGKVAMMAAKGAELDELVAADPVAAATTWTPLRRGGRAVLRPHRMVSAAPERLELRPSLQSWLFHLGLMAIGGIVIAYSLRQPGALSGSEPGRLVVAAVGLAFVLWAIYQLSSTSGPVCFDRQAAVMRRGWSNAGGGSVTPLTEIHAVQIIQEQCYTSKASQHRVRFMSYELNLVRKDGSRINLLDQRGRAAVQDCGRRIADFLGVPLWDMSSI